MAEYIFSEFEGREDISIINVEYPRFSGIKKLKFQILRYMRSFLFNRRGFATDTLYTGEFIDQIKKIGKEDAVLLFHKNLKDILILNKEIESRKFNVCIWDSLCTKSSFSKMHYVYCVHKDKITLHTIDKQDADNQILYM